MGDYDIEADCKAAGECKAPAMKWKWLSAWQLQLALYRRRRRHPSVETSLTRLISKWLRARATTIVRMCARQLQRVLHRVPKIDRIRCG